MLKPSYSKTLKLQTNLFIVLTASYVSYLLLARNGADLPAAGLLLGFGVLATGGLIILSRPLFGLVFIVASLPLQLVWPELPLIFEGQVPFITSILVPIGLATLAATLLHIQAGIVPPIRWRPEHLVALFYILWIVASNTDAAFGGSRIWAWTFVQLWIIMVLSSVLLRNPRDSVTLVIFFVGAVVVSTIGGWIAGNLDISQEASFTTRFRGLQGTPAEFSVLAVLSLAALNFMWPHFFRRWQKAVMIVSATILLAAILFSLSRSGVLALSALAIVLALWKVRWGGWLIRRHVPVGLFVFSIAILVLFAPGSYRNLLFGSIVTELRENTGTTQLRLEAWRIARVLWLQNPVAGVGVGNFVDHVREHWSIPRQRRDIVVHNSYLSVLSENGTVGAFLFVSWQFLALRRFWRGIRAESEPGIERDTRLMWLSFLVIWAVYGLVGSVQYGKILWIAGGAASALSPRSSPVMAPTGHGAKIAQRGSSPVGP
jgi:O-antigen ligase